MIFRVLRYGDDYTRFDENEKPPGPPVFGAQYNPTLSARFDQHIYTVQIDSLMDLLHLVTKHGGRFTVEALDPTAAPIEVDKVYSATLTGLPLFSIEVEDD